MRAISAIRGEFRSLLSSPLSCRLVPPRSFLRSALVDRFSVGDDRLRVYVESTLRDASTHREISVSDNLIRRESGTKKFPHDRSFRSRSSFYLSLSLSVPVSSNRLSAMSTRSSARPLSTFIHVSFSAQLQFLPRTFRTLLSAFTLKSRKAIIE